MKEEFDLVVEVTITYLKTIHADDQEEAQAIAENKGYEYLEAEGILKDACWEIDGVWEVQEKEQA